MVRCCVGFEMKRTAYDSEYDRVRRQSGMSRLRPEFDVDEPGVADPGRVARAHEDFKRHMAELTAIETKQRAETKARADEFSMAANRAHVLGEYLGRGVEPPFTDEQGNPTVSLSLLMQMGWRIEGNWLVPPGWRAPETLRQN